LSATAIGALRLAEGEIAAAAISLQQACAAWQELAIPCEEARTRLLLATVSERRGDPDGRQFELDAARRLLDPLPSRSRVPTPDDRTTRNAQASGSLSERELQVLRLLASGRTNRAIAEELFISEKTVARHVSNIFDKLGVSNRTGATAWAFQQNLI
jgi:DNA-binding NarL/FixJ family response regulator